MDLRAILEQAVADQASDIFIVAGRPITVRKSGSVSNLTEEKIFDDTTSDLLRQIYEIYYDNCNRLAIKDTDSPEEAEEKKRNHAQARFKEVERNLAMLKDNGDDDFSISIPGLSRFRCNAFKQRGSLSAVIRVITFDLPDPTSIGIPEYITNLAANSKKGMILVTGPAGSGKSTTLACMIDKINRTQNKHVITLEDPIEYLHRHDQSIVSQREVSIDTQSYATALRASLRQSPDIILLGEMRDYETIDVAMTAAETGHLLLSTLHTIGAANTIERIIDIFPANQQHQIAIQLSMVLSAVVSQQLIPAIGGGVVCAFEIMTVTPGIRNMIRDVSKINQIKGQLESADREDMISMDNSILKLYQAGKITRENAMQYATNPEWLERKLGR